ncbi:PEP-CTERM sorting domain-containing protein [Crocosphaera watsonii]|uniref:PEP-CTERM sorting domain-containing protein n=1 Tax=Crocosphaera watsonii TaxID=263511 RepID=UPI0002D2B75B|nr:PEP-CTERM sorting domain-containing protein [Crocosphaera watsonii]
MKLYICAYITPTISKNFLDILKGVIYSKVEILFINKTLIGVLTISSSLCFTNIAEAASVVKSFTSTLDAGQEVTFSDSQATGTAVLNLLRDTNGDYSLQYKLTVTENGTLDFSALETPPGTEITNPITVTKLHLHGGASRGFNGVLPFNIKTVDPDTGNVTTDIDDDLVINIMTGTTMISGLLEADEFPISPVGPYDSFDDVVTELLATAPGQDTSLYWNIHTLGLSGGAIRGQLQAVPEPLTILGAGTAIAFGTGFKRKLGKAKKK